MAIKSLIPRTAQHNIYGIYENTGADNNLIMGNSVQNNVTSGLRLIGSNTIALHNLGHKLVNWGTTTDITDANGNITIAHGLTSTPTYINVEMSGDNTYDAIVQSVDNTNITVRVRDTANNSDVDVQAITVYWYAHSTQIDGILSAFRF